MRVEIGPFRALLYKRGRIPVDDFHKSSSEGEGACSRTCAGRSHLPLRGKLGWMTPRPGREKEDRETECVFGVLVPKQGPLSIYRSRAFTLSPPETIRVFQFK
jgi:hypothetical protein